jgi:hypothetical protein
MIYKINGKHIDLSKIVMIDEVTFKYISSFWNVGFNVHFQLMDNPITLFGPQSIDGIEYTSENIQERKIQYENALLKECEKMKNELVEAWKNFVNK